MSSDHIQKLPLSSLDEQHLNPLQNAVRHILSTKQAEYILAQVVEGMPTREISLFKDHKILPEIAERGEPDVKAFDVLRRWREGFHIESLEIASTVRSY